MFTLKKDFSILRLVVLVLLVLGYGTYAYSQSINRVGSSSSTTIPLKNADFQDLTSLGGTNIFSVVSRAVADGIDTVAVVLPISRYKFFGTPVTATKLDVTKASSRYDSISVGGAQWGTLSSSGPANATGDTLFIYLARSGATARIDSITLTNFTVTPNTVNISNNPAKNFTYITLVDTVKYALFNHGGSILKNSSAGPRITLTPGPIYKLNWSARGRAPQNGAAVMATAAIDATADTLYLLDFNNNITSNTSTVVSLDAVIPSTGNPGSGIFYGSTLSKPTGGGRYVYTNLKYSKSGTFKARASATGVLSDVAAATFIVKAGKPNIVSASLSKTSIDMNTTTDFTVTAVDTFYNAVSNNARVKFTETVGGGGSYGGETGIIPVSGENSPVYIGYFPSTGRGTVTYTSAKNYIGTVTTNIGVQADSTAGSAVVCTTTVSITVTGEGEAIILATPHDTSVTVGSTSTFRVIAQDAYGNQITSGLSAGDITATAQKGTVGTITLSGLMFLVPYTPSTTRGMDTITYKLGATQYTTISSVSMNSGPPATVILYETAGDSTIVASKATNSVTLQAMAKDAYGNNVNGSLYKLRFTIVTSGPSGSWKSGSRGASAIKDTVTAVIADSIVSLAFYSDTLAQAAVQVEALYPTTSNFASATVKGGLSLKIKLDTVSVIANTLSPSTPQAAGASITITSRLTDVGGNNIAVSDTGSIRYVLVKGRGTLADATTRTTTTDGAVQIVYTTYLTLPDTAKIQTTATNNAAITNTVTIISVPTGTLQSFLVTINTADASKIAGDSVNITITAMDLFSNRIFTYNDAGQTVTLNKTTVSPVVTKDTTYYFSYTDKNGKYVKRSDGIALTDSIFVQGLASITLRKFKAEDTANTVTVTVPKTFGSVATTSANGSIFNPSSPAGQTTWSVTLKDTVGLNTPFNYTITPCDKYYNINSTVPNFIYVSSNQGTNFSAGSTPKIFTGPVTYTAIQSVATNNLIIYVFDSTSTILLGQSKAIVAKAGVTGVEENNGLPTAYSLLQNYPNPFNPSTTIQFGLPVSSPVTMEIYNVLGVKVRTLIHGEVMNAAMHQVVWNGKDNAGVPVASGVYLYRINAGTFQVSKKMMMLK